MSRRPTEESMLVKEYARTAGHTVQWARRQRQANTSAWQSFLAGRIADSNGIAEGNEASRAMTDLDRARLAKASAWDAYLRADQIARQSGNDPAVLAALNRAMKEARATYEAACKHETALALEAQRYIPISRVAEIRAVLPQLTDVVQNLRTNIAGRLPDEMRPAFYAAFDAVRPAWNAGIDRVDAVLQALLPVPL